MLQRLAAFALADAIGLLGFTATVTAQPYPSRTVTIVCPYPAGGPTDQTARVLADFLSKKFNQSFVVENVTGGGTTIATNRVAKASPDGYRCCCTICRLPPTPRCTGTCRSTPRKT